MRFATLSLSSGEKNIFLLVLTDVRVMLEIGGTNEECVERERKSGDFGNHAVRGDLDWHS